MGGFKLKKNRKENINEQDNSNFQVGKERTGGVGRGE